MTWWFRSLILWHWGLSSVGGKLRINPPFLKKKKKTIYIYIYIGQLCQLTCCLNAINAYKCHKFIGSKEKESTFFRSFFRFLNSIYIPIPSSFRSTECLRRKKWARPRPWRRGRGNSMRRFCRREVVLVALLLVAVLVRRTQRPGGEGSWAYVWLGSP